MKITLLIFATNTALFDKIENSDFGRTLLNEPFERILQTLYDQIYYLQIADQKVNNTHNQAFQQLCDADLAGLNLKLANLESRNTELQAVIDDLIPIKDQYIGQNKAKELQKAELQQAIDVTTAKRSEQIMTLKLKDKNIHLFQLFYLKQEFLHNFNYTV